MGYKQIVILLISCFVLIIFFNLPAEKNWLNKRIYSFSRDYEWEREHMDLEERRARRWGTPYAAIVGLKKHVDTMKIAKPLILMPPREYYQKINPKIFVPEPVVCYYFAGLRTTRIECEDVYDATGCILFTSRQGEVTFQPLNGKQEIDRIINVYKNN